MSHLQPNCDGFPTGSDSGGPVATSPTSEEVSDRAIARFWAKVDKDNGPVHPTLGRCWIWTGARNAAGYGHAHVGADQGLAHVIAFELVVGPVPPGLELDHLCRNRPCVNPTHVEPVTHRQNLLRGETIPALNAAKTHCPKGHEYTEANTYRQKSGSRMCRACVWRNPATRKACGRCGALGHNRRTCSSPAGEMAVAT